MSSQLNYYQQRLLSSLILNNIYCYYFGHISAMTFEVVAEKLPLATTIVVANIKIDLRRQYRR
jgi:hypothetical protein